MAERRKLIEEIMESFYAIRNKMHVRLPQSGHRECTYSQLFVLAIIEHHKDIGIKEISKKLGISSSAATQLVDGLADNGYAVRKIDINDRRALRLELSVKGRKRIADLKNKRIKIVSALFDALSDNELKTYLNLNKKILSKINL